MFCSCQGGAGVNTCCPHTEAAVMSVFTPFFFKSRKRNDGLLSDIRRPDDHVPTSAGPLPSDRGEEVFRPVHHPDRRSEDRRRNLYTVGGTGETAAEQEARSAEETRRQERSRWEQEQARSAREEACRAEQEARRQEQERNREREDRERREEQSRERERQEQERREEQEQSREREHEERERRKEQEQSRERERQERERREEQEQSRERERQEQERRKEQEQSRERERQEQERRKEQEQSRERERQERESREEQESSRERERQESERREEQARERERREEQERQKEQAGEHTGDQGAEEGGGEAGDSDILLPDVQQAMSQELTQTCYAASSCTLAARIGLHLFLLSGQGPATQKLHRELGVALGAIVDIFQPRPRANSVVQALNGVLGGEVFNILVQSCAGEFMAELLGRFNNYHYLRQLNPDSILQIISR